MTIRALNNPTSVDRDRLQGAGCTAVIRVTTQAATDTIVNPVWRYIEWVFWERLPGPFAMALP